MKLSLAAAYIEYVEARNINDIQNNLLLRNIIAKVEYHQVPTELPQFFVDGKMFPRVEVTVSRTEYTLRLFADFKDSLEIFVLLYDGVSSTPASRKVYTFQEHNPDHIYDVLVANLT